ncbi:MAG TPA: hypothetical protein VFP05_18520 [Thermomicrobiales bacterium]|nr:hypothetical protein [Thermomicrobiales bacterium]
MTRAFPSSTRRTVLASSVAATAALALRNAAAQSGTPEASDEVELLFVQAAGSGTLTPSDQGSTLSFRHDTGQTIYFSDRPERLTGLLPTAELVAQWPFEDESPPNAALAISNTEDSSAQVFVGVLSNPVWDAGSATLSYGFWMLSDDIPAGSPTPVPSSFDAATLFIDGANRGIIVANMTGRSIQIGIWKKPPR